MPAPGSAEDIMDAKSSFEKCRAYMESQLQSRKGPARAARTLQSGPAITISRQTGAGAHTIAAELAAFLDQHGPAGKCPWTVFDRTLVEKVLEEHNLPRDFERFLREDRRSYLDEIMEEVLGLHPPSWNLVRQVTETILNLADLGRVILVGRGAHIITARMANVFHVRLVGSLEKRVEYAMEFYKLPRRAAAEFVRKTDRGRAAYVRKHFQCDVDDCLQYHLVINTDRISFADAAQVIGTAALNHFK
jgi:cytidylate kinase